MKPIPIKKSLSDEDYQYDQIKRNDTHAIYQVSHHGQIINFHVIQIIVLNFVSGQVETYPSYEQWGTHGWSFRTLPEAQAKFDELTKTNHQ